MAKRIPKMYQRPDGRAAVRINGRTYYLGPVGSPESLARYQKLIAEFLIHGGVIERRTMPTVAMLAHAYLLWVRANQTGRRKDHRTERSLRVVVDLFADLDADKFGPRSLKSVRQEMVNRGWTRRNVNACVGSIKRCWKWAASEELVPASVFQSLATVEGLRYGATGVGEAKGRRVVDPQTFAACVAEMPSPLREALVVMWHTGARPNEVLAMRADEIERRDVWVYRPAGHKNAWRGMVREIVLGPESQAAIARTLADRSTGYVFRPVDSPRGKRWADRERYYEGAFRWAIRRACLRAGVAPFPPYAVRDTFATRISAQYGPDVARRMLGHRSLTMTGHYDHMEISPTIRAAKEAG